MNSLSLIILVLLLIAFGVSFFLFYNHNEKKLETALRRSQKSERLKSVFIDNMCHSLNTPLKAIMGYSNMILEIQDEQMQPEQVKKLATNIKKDSQQLINFISQLFELSKYEGITPSFTFIEVNLTELMASYRRETLNVTKPDVSVHVKTDLSPHCKAFLDTNFMHQLMMHILTNAAKQTTQGNIIIQYGYERKGIKVSITYTGFGQADLMYTDVYTLLQKEDALVNANESPVLGFSICKAIVEILGGELLIDTEHNKKTVVSFWFPCKMRDRNK